MHRALVDVAILNQERGMATDGGSEKLAGGKNFVFVFRSPRNLRGLCLQPNE